MCRTRPDLREEDIQHMVQVNAFAFVLVRIRIARSTLLENDFLHMGDVNGFSFV